MGTRVYSQKFKSAISAERMFWAFFLGSHNVLPKVASGLIESIKFIKRNDKAGSIMQINFVRGARIKYRKYRIDALDTKNLSCKYTLIESDARFHHTRFVSSEVRFYETDQGSACQMTTKYHLHEGAVLGNERFRDCRDFSYGKDILPRLWKHVENYLVEHPDLSAPMLLFPVGKRLLLLK